MTAHSIHELKTAWHPSWCAADEVGAHDGLVHVLDLSFGVRIEQPHVPSAVSFEGPVILIEANFTMTSRDAFERAARLAHAANLLGLDESLPPVRTDSRAA